MTTLFASPRLFIATVDFNLEICPILVNAQEVRGCWITLDYCQEGRCEVANAGESAIIVKPGRLLPERVGGRPGRANTGTRSADTAASNCASATG